MTAADRLKLLSGMAGVSAGAMLAAIGVGLTAGDRLVDYSGLTSGSAAQHILVDHGGTQYAVGTLTVDAISSFAPSAAGLSPTEFSFTGTGYGSFAASGYGSSSFLIDGYATLSGDSQTFAVAYGELAGTTDTQFAGSATAESAYAISSHAAALWQAIDSAQYPANGWYVVKVLTVGKQVVICADQRSEVLT